MFPDIEDALCEFLEPISATVTASGEYEAKIDDEGTMTLHGIDGAVPPPFIVINRTGGSTDRLGLNDTAEVAVEVYGVKRAQSQDLNKQVRAALAGARAVATSAGFIDTVTENTSPTEIPYGEEANDVRRVTSNWLVVSRLQ